MTCRQSLLQRSRYLHRRRAPWIFRSASRTRAVFGASLLAVSVCQTAVAQDVVADTLFEEGRALMQAGEYEEACRKLAESHRIDPATGTLLNLGLCYEKSGKTASAWSTFRDAAAMAKKEGHADRTAFAEEHVRQLEPRLSRVILVVKDAVPGLVVRVNGREMARPVWGVALPTDPGQVHVVAEAPEKRRWSKTIQLDPDGDFKAVRVPAFTTVGPTEPVVPSSGPVLQDVRPAEPASTEPTSAPTWGYAVGGAGLLLVGVGGYFGWKATSSWDKRNDHCSERGCDDTGIELGDDTNRYANFANAAIGLGAVGIGVGTFAILFSGDNPVDREAVRITPAIGSESAAMTLGGTW